MPSRCTPATVARIRKSNTASTGWSTSLRADQLEWQPSRIGMPNPQPETPENTAVRVALWRAMHVQIDSPPHVLEDEIGLQLVDPDPDWRQRPDMEPQFTRSFRAAIVARALHRGPRCRTGRTRRRPVRHSRRRP